MVIVTPPPIIAGYTAVFYMTAAGGSVFYDPTGIQLNDVQILANPFVVGSPAIAYHASSVWIARPMPNGSTVIIYSAPFYHHLFDAVQNYIVVPGEVRAMASTGEALIIGTDVAIYSFTDKLTPLAHYGVPPGRPFVVTPDGMIKIFTYRGCCEALPFANLTETKALFAPGVQCSTALVNQGGIQKFVTLSDGSGTPYNTRT
jgi:hypothetical protein